MGTQATAELMRHAPAAADKALDLAFEIRGSPLPADHRHALRAAIAGALTWFEAEPTAAIHPLKSAHAVNGAPLLSRRSRLVLRVPVGRQTAAGQLAGQVLSLADATLAIGTSVARPLLGHGTLYAHLVTGNADDEPAFTAALREQLSLIEIAGEIICGRRQSLGAGERQLRGFSVMVHGLSRENSLRLQTCGVGRDMKLGCGVFVPHRSAAAVGS